MSVSLVAVPGVGTFQMYTHEKGDKYISRQISEHGVWEPFESRLVARLLKPGDVFLDLGANIGYYTLLAARACGPGGAVFAFEPEPGNFRLLLRNLELNGIRNVTAVNAAADAATGRTALFLSEDNQGDHRIYAGDGRSAPVEVPAVALDDWFAGRDTRIDLVKMDTQGSEARIIDGMAGLIESNRDRIRMIVEFWPFGLAGAGDSARGLVERLRRFGLAVQKIDETHSEPVPTTWEQLLQEAETLYRPATQNFTNLLLSPR